ncbi:MAG: aminoacyl-tRNA hydrolase [Candidatus Margulisiibacteriota bacterium]
MYLIVGLGNPGLEYAPTRHNLGFRVIDALARRFPVVPVTIEKHKVILAKPQTFMNNSGVAVRGLLEWYKISPQKLILIYDDVDLEVGQLRLREKGAAGGHHGVESVIEHVKATDFSRVRIGIGRNSLSGDIADYVLQKIPPAQQEPLELAITTAADAVVEIVKNGIASAMNKYNNRD